MNRCLPLRALRASIAITLLLIVKLMALTLDLISAWSRPEPEPYG